jgi:hypothetical protein
MEITTEILQVCGLLLASAGAICLIGSALELIVSSAHKTYRRLYDDDHARQLAPRDPRDWDRLK